MYSNRRTIIVDPIIAPLSGIISDTVKILLENKHLYQSIDVNFEQEKRDILSRKLTTQEIIEILINGGWEVIDEAYTRPPLGQNTEIKIAFHIPDIKLYCTYCERLEAFNAISAEDFLARSQGGRGTSTQIFAMSFQCQSCKGLPEVFIVKRLRNKLQICDRAPIEHIDVPIFIPKELTRFYSGAMLAYQSGQTLAANFLLRTLVEQWTRLITTSAISKDIDIILEDYNKSLPKDFVSRFPSLKSIYATLSADIHSAKGDYLEFEKSLKGIQEHFEARKVFKL